jgi:hypothetical protein
VSAGLRALISETRGRDFDRSIHNRPSLHIDSVGKWFATRCAPRISVAGENLCLASSALANWRRGRLPKLYNDLFLIHFFTF